MQEEYLHLSLQLPAEPPGGGPLDVNHLLADSLAVCTQPADGARVSEGRKALIRRTP